MNSRTDKTKPTEKSIKKNDIKENNQLSKGETEKTQNL